MLSWNLQCVPLFMPTSSLTTPSLRATNCVTEAIPWWNRPSLSGFCTSLDTSTVHFQQPSSLHEAEEEEDEEEEEEVPCGEEET